MRGEWDKGLKQTTATRSASDAPEIRNDMVHATDGV
jgi:hypothetical protein